MQNPGSSFAYGTNQSAELQLELDLGLDQQTPRKEGRAAARQAPQSP
jgi:hypothetical protein